MGILCLRTTSHHLIFSAAAASLLLPVVWKLFKVVLLEPWAIRRMFEKQGVNCLPYNVLLGNGLEIARMANAALASPLPLVPHQVGPRIVPYIYHWRKIYGDLFVFWAGPRAVLAIMKPDAVREILSSKAKQFQKVVLRPDPVGLIGKSVASLEGERWALHRRIVSPAFFSERVKGMAPTTIACVTQMLDEWERQLEGHESTEIDVFEQFKVLTGDIMTCVAFGSSYIEEGKKVFALQEEQRVLMLQRIYSIYIPGYRYLPTPENRKVWRLKQEIHDTILKIIKSREQNCVEANDDLLGILLAANQKELSGTPKNLSLTMQEIMDECKTFFFAGQETTAGLMTWTTMLLAMNPEWQDRAREEVLQICGQAPPTHELLHNMKVVGMVLNEALRLYPPGPLLMREPVKEVTVGGISVPPKTILLLNIINMHCDPALWGDDALDFNPQRFGSGVSGACKTAWAFCPFSMGPRVCLGQNFAMMEARAILAIIVQRFTFSLSASYSHRPITRTILQPQQGMQIIFRKLCQN